MQSKSIADKIKTEVLLMICQLCNKSIDNNLINLWVLALSDLTHEQLNKGMERTAREYKGTFLMAPAQFREYCLTEVGESVEDEAREAFNTMMKHGYTLTKNCHFKNHITAQVMRQIGQQYRDYNTDNLDFKKKDFVKDYEVLKKRGEQYNQFILLPEDHWNRPDKPRLIGQYNDIEKTQVTIEFTQELAQLAHVKQQILTHETKQPTQTNKANFTGGMGGLLNKLKKN
jgi:hypothetical protein